MLSFLVGFFDRSAHAKPERLPAANESISLYMDTLNCKHSDYKISTHGNNMKKCEEHSERKGTHKRNCDIKDFSVAHLNIRSLMPKIQPFTELFNRINADIFAISETWLNSTIPNEYLSIPGWSCEGIVYLEGAAWPCTSGNLYHTS